MYKSSVITNKGKSAQSYFWINGCRIPCWVHEAGGFEIVIKNISNLIKEGKSIHHIREIYNISATTAKKFIKNNLFNDLISAEINNRKLIASQIRSNSLKGKVNPNKGKTYREIYGTDSPACGFKSGDQNPNFTRNKFVGCNIRNKSGKKFRSSYEVQFSELLESANIAYEYENQYKLCNGKVKIVDFIVNNKLVEITGYAYAAWKEDFDAKIQLLKLSYPESCIVIVSTRDNISELKDKHNSIAHIFAIEDSDTIIKFLT